jgi:calcineurin-like phosphoesterase family protein
LMGDVMVVLMHYPLESWHQMERGAIHLHGHVHGGGRKIPGRYDVGFETPYFLINEQDVRKLEPANTYRHKTLNGGSKFGV